MFLTKPPKPLRYLLVLLISLTLSVSSFYSMLAQATAQALGPDIFYFISYNETSESNTIWEASMISENSRPILTLEGQSNQSPREAFPESEFLRLEDAISRGVFWASVADASHIGQETLGVWGLDSERLLVLASYYVSHAYYHELLGYYEFSILNIPDGTLSSLTKIAYYQPLAGDWGCDPNTPVWVSDVKPNPTSDRFAYTLKIEDRWCSSHRGQTYIVDYSTSPAEITEIPWANKIAWDPDGAQLAYTTRALCGDHDCPAGYYTLSMTPGATPTMIDQHEIYGTSPTPISWLNNQSVVYQYDEPPTENPLAVGWYDLTQALFTPSQFDVGLSGFSSIIYLHREQTHLLIGFDTDQSEFNLMRFTDDLETVDTLPSDSIYYNSRFNQYVFLGLGDNSTQILDADANLFPLDLAPFTPSGETIHYLAPGPIGAPISLPFEEDFETSILYWSTTGSWALNDTESHSDSHASSHARISGDSFSDMLALNWPIYLATATAPELTYWTQTQLTQYETAYIEVSTDDGSTWNPVQQLTQTKNLGWTRQRINLSAYVGQQIRLRFRVEGNSCLIGDDFGCTVETKWWLDDIQVAEANTTTFSVPFNEDFEANLDNWIAEGTWATSGEHTRETTSYGAASDSPGTNYTLRTNTALELVHPLDFSGFTAPGLTYWTRYDLAADHHAYVEASTDNGVTWSVLEDLTTTNTNWEEHALNLTVYANHTIRLRFRLDASLGTSVADGWWIDDLNIIEQPNPYLFFNDFESGTDDWSLTGQWMRTYSTYPAPPTYPRTYLMYASSGSIANSLLTTLDPVLLGEGTSPQLIYSTSYDIQSMSHRAYVEVSTDDGQTWQIVDTISYGRSSGSLRTIDLSSYALPDPDPDITQPILIRFRLYASTQYPSSLWRVDNVRVQQ